MTTRPYEFLGGDGILNRSIHTALDVHDLIVEGIPAASLQHLVERMRILSAGDVLNTAIGTDIRTLHRRNPDGMRALSTEHGSRAWRFAQIIAKASDILGTQEAGEAWVLEPAIGLDNRRPIDLLASAAGAKAVKEYLTRVEYGVYM